MTLTQTNLYSNCDALLKTRIKHADTNSHADVELTMIETGEFMTTLTALIADDSLSARNLLREALEKAGMNVTESKDGNDALQQAKEHNFDIVLADLYLPKIDGVELTNELRKHPDYTDTPILAISNNKASSKKAAVKEAGASGIIRLPISTDDLLAVLKKLLPV